MQTNRTRIPGRQAFTLIEMLVVAALVMILAGVLLPVFSKMRAQSGFMMCTINLREIGAAHQCYVNDYQQFCPLILNRNGASYSTDYNWHLRLEPYLRKQSVFVCHSAARSGYNANQLDYGLSMGFYLLYDAGVLQDDVPVTPGYILYPVFTILGADSMDTGSNDAAINHPASPVGPTPAPPASQASNRHRNGSNALFADLHVQWLAKQKIDAGTLGGSGYLWDTGGGNP